MLRKKMLAVAVAATAFAAPAAYADSKNVDIYGVIAFGFMLDDPQEAIAEDASNWTVLNESRIGFRGSKQFKNWGPKFIWQIESGFLGGNGLGNVEYSSGSLGVRDTFAGFEGDFGKIRFGRLLTPIGEVLDWPHANGGLNPIVEAAKVFYRFDDSNYVRHSNMFRWDSPAGGAVSGSVALGRGLPNNDDPMAHLGTPDSLAVSALLNVKVGSGTVYFGYESHKEDMPFHNADGFAGAENQDTTTTLVGFNFPLTGGLSTYGVVMKGTNEVNPLGIEGERLTWQVALQYASGDWIFKLTHGNADNLEIDGDEIEDTDGSMTAIQALYLVDPSAVMYARYVSASDMETRGDPWVGGGGVGSVVSGYKSRLLIGMEYYF